MVYAHTLIGMLGPTQEALAGAVERALTGVGLGTLIAFALAAVVWAVEVLARRYSGHSREPKRRGHPRASASGRNEALR
jgi:hypothetical protein